MKPHATGLTQEESAEKMKNWGWFREKVIHFEENNHFCLNPAEMQALFDAVDASSV